MAFTVGGSYVVVQGLRYVVPYEVRNVVQVKDRYIGWPVARALGDMFRRNKGTQVALDRCGRVRDGREENALHGHRTLMNPRRSGWARSRGVASGCGERNSALMTRGSSKRAPQTLSSPKVYSLPGAALFHAGRICPNTRVCLAGDSIEVTKHVHERVVAAASPTVLQETDAVCVINKPACIPCTASEGGVANVVSIASRAMGRTLYACHRLDLPVSGVLLLAKTGRAQRRVLEAMGDKTKATKVCRQCPCTRGLDKLMS